jgi:negative regulator of sigma E activity
VVKVKAAKLDAKPNTENSAGGTGFRAGIFATGQPRAFSIDDLDPHECVAALADSSLSDADAQVALDRLLQSPEMCASWHRLHRTSDYLRSEEMADCEGDAAFWDGFSARLKDEPTVFVPGRARNLARRGVWLRYGLPGISVVAAVAMVGWMVIPQYRGGDDPASAGVIASEAPAALQTPANLQPQIAASASEASYSEPVELERYLGAHQQFSPRNVHGPVALESASFSTIRATDAYRR